MIDTLKALADETRLRILAQILKGDMCVCEIEKCLGLTQSNASRHLTILARAEILESYKIAQWAYFKVSKTFMSENPELLAYLKKRLESIPYYQADSENYDKCKQQNLCGNKKI